MFYGKKVLESNCFANQSAISICNAIVQQQEKESVAEQPAPQYAIFRSSARPLNEEEEEDMVAAAKPSCKKPSSVRDLAR